MFSFVMWQLAKFVICYFVLGVLAAVCLHVGKCIKRELLGRRRVQAMAIEWDLWQAEELLGDGYAHFSAAISGVARYVEQGRYRDAIDALKTLLHTGDLPPAAAQCVHSSMAIAYCAIRDEDAAARSEWEAERLSSLTGRF